MVRSPAFAIDHRCRNTGVRLARNACIPSFWPSAANIPATNHPGPTAAAQRAIAGSRYAAKSSFADRCRSQCHVWPLSRIGSCRRPRPCENHGPRLRSPAWSSKAYREGVGMPRHATRRMPRRPACHSPAHERRKRAADSGLWEQRLPAVPDQSAVHTEQQQKDCVQGTRGGARRHAATTRPAARGDDATAMHGRTRLRNAQVRDGFDALPDQETGQRRHRDAPAPVRTRLEACDAPGINRGGGGPSCQPVQHRPEAGRGWWVRARP
jgi:hypothetical protein